MVFDNDIALFHFLFFLKMKSRIHYPRFQDLNLKYLIITETLVDQTTSTGRLHVQRSVHPTAFFPVPRIMQPSHSCGAMVPQRARIVQVES
jgi:hypothetical protein